MEYTDIHGGFLISQNDNNQILLFKNMIYPDKFNTHYIVCFRFEYIEDSWTIFPMRSYYTKKENLYVALDFLISHNWFIPDDYFFKKEFDDISEDELSIGNDS